LPRIGDKSLALSLLPALFLCTVAAAQPNPQVLASSEPGVTVRSVRAFSAHDGPAVEIISSRPVVPTIHKLTNPLRLVIDLPDTTLPEIKKAIDFQTEQVGGLRVSQFQQSPPVVRIVVDLAKPVAYTWDAAGNRLMIRLRAEQEPPKATAAPSFTAGVQPVAVPLGPGSRGLVVLAGSRIPTGSSVTAGSETSVLRLGRGGEVRVCPGTTVSVTASQSGHALMLGMSTGSLEAHYTLDASADSILTPDFRILLAGPGEFHYGVSADSRGNTCIQALPGNTASVIVSELLGDGTYQVKPTEQVVFHEGQLRAVDNAVPATCGCPNPEPAVMRTNATPAPQIPENKSPSTVRFAPPQGLGAPSTLKPASLPSPVTPAIVTETAPLPASRPDDVHVQVEAPFVFRGDDPPPAAPAPTREVATLPLASPPHPTFEPIAVLPPVETRAAHRSVLARIGHFFRSIFG